MLVIPIDAAVSGIGTVAATLITTPVYPMDVAGVGTASVAITASSVIPVGVTGEGEALAVFAQLIEAPVSGVGTASVGVKPSIALAAGVTGLGTASATVTPVATIVAAASCEGIPSAGAWPAALVTIAATGSGTPIAGLTARAPINASASGTGSAAAAITVNMFIQQSMTKNGDQQLTSSSTWTPITAWAADSNTAVAGNALQVKGSGTATIEVGSAWTVLGTANKDWRVLKNGTVVWTKGASTGQTFAHSFSLALTEGDFLTCEGWNNSGVAANRTVASGSGTYLRVIPA